MAYSDIFINISVNNSTSIYPEKGDYEKGWAKNYVCCRI